MKKLLVVLLLVLCISAVAISYSEDAGTAGPEAIDAKVKKFLESNRYSWRDMNIPEVDGKALYDIIVEHKYTKALEIGTSTGHSTIWIAWALSKTGGKVITLEIDKSRYEEAKKNFREAGLEKYIDARLGDAHEIVPALKGPFDFVFCDADKDWYKNYLSASVDKLEVGGCFAAHNVMESSSQGFDGRRRWGRRGGGRGRMGGDYLEHARSFSFLDTKVLDIPGTGGIAVSYKKEKSEEKK